MRNPGILGEYVSFRNVWLGQVLSQAGSKAYLINLLWWLVDRPGADAHHAAWASGALLLASALPPILLSRPIGRLLTRHASQRVIVTAELCGAALVALVFACLWWQVLSLPVLLVVSALVATCQGCVDPALTKSVTELVPAHKVEQAVAFEASTQSLAYFAGTALGATLTGLLGLEAAVLLNALSYLLSAALTWRARFTPAGAPDEAPSEGGLSAAAVAAGASVQRLLRAFAAANFLLFPLFLILPLFTRNELHASVTVLGALEALFWLGLIAGAALSQRVPESGGLPAVVARSLLAFGLALCAVMAWPRLAITAAALLVGGLAVGLVNVKVMSFFQQQVPDADKGVFFARLQALVTAGQPLGYLVFTGLLSRLDTPAALGLQGLGLVLVGAHLWARAGRPQPGARCTSGVPAEPGR